MHRIPTTLDEVQEDGHAIIAVCRRPECRQAKVVDLTRIIGHLGRKTPLLPQPGREHYSDRMRCPACKRRGMFVWFQPKIIEFSPERLPNYRIIDHGSAYPFGSFTVIATADNLMIARAGYTAAAMFYHGHMITLQQGTYVIIDSKRDGLPPMLTLENYTEMREMERALNIGFRND